MKIGTHIIVEIYDIPEYVFNNLVSKENFFIFDNNIQEILIKNKMNVLQKNIHHFDNDNYNGAFTCIYLLSESHLSFHSWPEHSYIAMDIFTCGKCETQKIVDEILPFFETKHFNIKILERG